ncbi:hypothetical protein DNTS_031395 [Danionella cerebrum]|uniref:Ubiquitin-like domain-containing protein n=1 Tax=Danionella cerebrum TaxID=2873325 RepID=A0A553MMJ0_9TELE|nr:hypothetical protein DNTS_031395 [Danionella translucida]
MATDVCQTLTPNLSEPESCGSRQCVKGDPAESMHVPVHEHMKTTTHVALHVTEPVLQGSKVFSVKVFIGTTGKIIPVVVKGSDTIGKLRKKLLELSPNLAGCGNLAYNGKPLKLNKSLTELNIAPGAILITYRRCPGG